MQLAKNLYLEREKNLSRKLQEAVLTTYLEQALTKDEILELYFNIVEFGPMIYGIGPAAEHYFDTSPTISRSDRRSFSPRSCRRRSAPTFSPTGQVTKGWLGYLHRLMKIMRDRKKINDQELIDGVSEVITYHVAKSPRVRPSTTSSATSARHSLARTRGSVGFATDPFARRAKNSLKCPPHSAREHARRHREPVIEPRDRCRARRASGARPPWDRRTRRRRARCAR